MYDQLRRPQIHFSPRANWMNDPNGCVFFRGRYHLYFQYYPYETTWGPMHWGHAVSKDLVTWEEKGIALYPDDQLGMAFSGSAIVDEDNVTGFFPDGPGLVAFYTSHLPGRRAEEKLQQQCMAYSRDEGETWIPYEGNPVVPNPGITDFRDPKVFFHGPSEAWIMVVVAGYEAHFYRSRNLVDWDFAGRFGEGEGYDGGVWECPDLFSLAHPSGDGSTVWILAVSCLSYDTPGHSPLQYFVGEFDGHRFTHAAPPETVSLVDHGHDFYATQSWYGTPEGDRRQIWIGWANHWAYAREVPTEPWRGVMSLPRDLELGQRDGRIVLRQRPIREIESLREAVDILADGAEAVAVDGSGEGALELIGLVRSAGEGTIRITFVFDDGERLEVSWDGGTRVVVVDRRGMAGTGFHPTYAPVVRAALPATDALDWRLIWDRSLLEMFLLDGECVFTSQIFPSAPLGRVEIRCGGGARPEGWEAYRLKSIWDANPESPSPDSRKKQDPVRDLEKNLHKEAQDD